MTARISRRRVLQLGAAGALGHLFTGPAVSAVRIRGVADRLRVAGIGIGGKGESDITQAGKFMNVVALCDIDGDRLDKRAAAGPCTAGRANLGRVRGGAAGSQLSAAPRRRSPPKSG